MTAQPLVFQLNDRVGTITFSRPKERNAVNPDMARAMGELARKLPGVEGLQAIVLRGSGIIGWGGRDRTSVWRNQNPLPYRLATPQSWPPDSGAGLLAQHVAEGFLFPYIHAGNGV